MIDAGLGRQEQAVQQAEHACDLATFESSAMTAPIVHCNLAVDEKDREHEGGKICSETIYLDCSD